MDLPAAPLSGLPGLPPSVAAWNGYPAPGSGFAPPDSSDALERPLITREQLVEHLRRADAWRSLPDGRPLRLSAEGMEYLIDDFGGFHGGELRSAHRLLFFATRSKADMKALWIPPVPTTEDAPDQDGVALHMRALQAEIGAWAADTFEPGAYREVQILAVRLWQALMDRLPVSAEKKNPPPPEQNPPDSSSPTSATSAGSSPAETPGATNTSSSAPTSAPSSPPSSDGPTSTEPASSPSPKSPAASPPPAL